MKPAQQRQGASSEPASCPRCGGAMNRHAEKVVYPGDPGDAPGPSAFEGVVAEFHTCPACLYVLERRTR